MGEVGRKDDAGKEPWNLMPWSALQPVIRVLAYGAKRYGAENWSLVADGEDRYFSAAIRHLVAWHSGEDLDPDTGERHLAHAACCVLFLIGLDLKGAK